MKGTIAALNLVALCIAAVCMLAQPVLAATAAVRPELTVAAAVRPELTVAVTATGAAGVSKAAPSEAEAAYDAMVAAWHSANSIYYESDYESSSGGRKERCSYRVWLLKPNYVRLEAYQGGQLEGVLVGDGSNFGICWRGGPPSGYTYENKEGARVSDVEASASYTTHAAPAGRHSVADDVLLFGMDLALISDPSMFSGSGDPMQRYIESGRLRGTETVGGERCDVLHLILGKANCETTLWLSQADHLPRKARQVIHGAARVMVTETWSHFTLNGEVAKDKFVWAPERDWRKVRKATAADENLNPGKATGRGGILEPGTVAPDFTLAGVNGEEIRLSDYRGNVVWLHIWFAG